MVRIQPKGRMSAAKGDACIEKGPDCSDILPAVKKQVRSDLEFLNCRLKDAGAKIADGTFGKGLRENFRLKNVHTGGCENLFVHVPFQRRAKIWRDAE